jgi:hypothetical protein
VIACVIACVCECVACVRVSCVRAFVPRLRTCACVSASLLLVVVVVAAVVLLVVVLVARSWPSPTLLFRLPSSLLVTLAGLHQQRDVAVSVGAPGLVAGRVVWRHRSRPHHSHHYAAVRAHPAVAPRGWRNGDHQRYRRLARGGPGLARPHCRGVCARDGWCGCLCSVVFCVSGVGVCVRPACVCVCALCVLPLLPLLPPLPLYFAPPSPSLRGISPRVCSPAPLSPVRPSVCPVQADLNGVGVGDVISSRLVFWQKQGEPSFTVDLVRTNAASVAVRVTPMATSGKQQQQQQQQWVVRLHLRNGT